MAELDKLLAEWKERRHHRGKGFILDGIIDPARWQTVQRKVLLLLKEAYGEGDAEADWDLREVIREEWEGPKYKIWWTAAYWLYAAQNVSPHIPEFPSNDEGWNAAAQALLSASFLNIKKSDGSSRSDDDDIRWYANRDGDLIRRQVELIDPEIVICGNTWWAIKHLWPDAKQIYGFVWKTPKFYVVDFWHPANQFPNEINYYALGCLLQNGMRQALQ